MRMLFKSNFKAKDDGPDSKVTGYFLIEMKCFFSVVIRRFDNGGRRVYHTHAFNALTFFLSGRAKEYLSYPNPAGDFRVWTPSFWPKLTRRRDMHYFESVGTTWALSFRGPWAKSWLEYDPMTRQTRTLTHGRKVVKTV